MSEANKASKAGHKMQNVSTMIWVYVGFANRLRERGAKGMLAQGSLELPNRAGQVPFALAKPAELEHPA